MSLPQKTNDSHFIASPNMATTSVTKIKTHRTPPLIIRIKFIPLLIPIGLGCFGGTGFRTRFLGGGITGCLWFGGGAAHDFNNSLFV